MKWNSRVRNAKDLYLDMIFIEKKAIVNSWLVFLGPLIYDLGLKKGWRGIAVKLVLSIICTCVYVHTYVLRHFR